MKTELENKFTKYEIARILGARSLQLAMDAPVLLKLNKEEESLNFDTLRIAEKELEADILPITVKRPLPKKSEREIKKLSDEELKEKLEEQKEKDKVKIDEIEEKQEETEENEEKEIQEEGDIMEIAKPEDEEDLADEDIGKSEI